MLTSIKKIRPAMLMAAIACFVVNQPAQATAQCSEQDLFCPAVAANDLAHTLDTFPVPTITSPNTAFAVGEFAVSKPITRTVTYTVTTKGQTAIDQPTFLSQVQTILDDPRGWSRLGLRFAYDPHGGAFTVVLSPAGEVPGFGSPCDTVYNCNVGNYVVVNEDRWLYATKPWNDAGGNIRDYRHLVINHELGHWLGHGHPVCKGVGQAAYVMMQQSIELGGCKFNAWPLDSEIWSTTLGI